MYVKLGNILYTHLSVMLSSLVFKRTSVFNLSFCYGLPTQKAACFQLKAAYIEECIPPSLDLAHQTATKITLKI